MKLYLHLDSQYLDFDSGLEPSTTIIKGDDLPSITVSSLIDVYLQVVGNRHGLLDKCQLQLFSSPGARKAVPLTALVGKVFSDAADVYVVRSIAKSPSGSVSSDVTAFDPAALPNGGNVAAASSAPVAAVAEVAVQMPSDARLNGSQSVIESNEGVSSGLLQAPNGQAQDRPSITNPATEVVCFPEAASRIPKVNSYSSAISMPFWARADQCVSEHNPHGAVLIYEQLLGVMPAHAATLARLGALWLSVEQPERGLDYARKAVVLCPEEWHHHKLLAECLRQSGALSESVEHYEAAINACRKAGEPASTEADLQILLCRALWGMRDILGCADVAADIVMAVLAQDESHWEGLLMYATIALERGLIEDSLKIALKLVTLRQHDNSVRALLAKCMQTSDGVDLVLELLGESSVSAAALAFLATCVKEHSAIDVAVTLYKKAVALLPVCASYSLNLIHTLELQQRLDEALKVASDFLAVCSVKFRLGGSSSLQDVRSILIDMPELGGLVSATWLAHNDCPPPTTSQGKPLPKVKYNTEELDTLALLFTTVKILFIGGALTAASVLVSMIQPAATASQQELHMTMIRNEAAYFGCVRQLLQPDNWPQPTIHHASLSLSNQSLSGNSITLSQNLQALSLDECQLASPASDALCSSPGSLSMESTSSTAGIVSSSTLGANAAVAVVASAAAAAAGLSSSGNRENHGDQALPAPLFLCGDSHCLSGAWRHVTLRGQTRLLWPALVTGCKVWHLRPESDFYPKAQFESTVAQLPYGAQVVMLLGEIDCREGLLLAVQKCKYDSLEEGINAAVAIYVEVLLGLVRTRGFEIFVHPPAPVLKATRKIVIPFQAALKKRILSAVKAERQLSNSKTAQATEAGKQGAHCSKKGQLHYLDFFDDLFVSGLQAHSLEENGSALENLLNSSPQLRPDLEFDGTHMAPAYVALMDAVLRRIV